MQFNMKPVRHEASSPDSARPSIQARLGYKGREFKSGRTDQSNSVLQLQDFQADPSDVSDVGKTHSIVSSGRGTSPRLRRISRSNAAKSARSRRSAKKAAVFIAASFSATAVATN